MVVIVSRLFRGSRSRKSNARYKNYAQRVAIRARVLAYYDTCHLCGFRVDKSLKCPHPLSGEVDEIIPIAYGGSPTNWENVRLAHRYCNEKRGTHSVEYAKQYLIRHPPPIRRAHSETFSPESSPISGFPARVYPLGSVSEW